MMTSKAFDEAFARAMFIATPDTLALAEWVDLRIGTERRIQGLSEGPIHVEPLGPDAAARILDDMLVEAMRNTSLEYHVGFDRYRQTLESQVDPEWENAEDEDEDDGVVGHVWMPPVATLDSDQLMAMHAQVNAMLVRGIRRIEICVKDAEC